MRDAERWADEHGFTNAARFRNDRGEQLPALLDSEPDATHSGVNNECWTFSDSSSIVLRFVTWEIE